MTGSDEIPNVILKECASILVPYLLHIFCAMFKLWTYYGQWREVITCVLCKPGKPRYNIPMAYRPIALLNSIAKLATSIVVEELSHLVEDVRATLRRGHSYTKILQDRGELNRRDTLTQW